LNISSPLIAEMKEKGYRDGYVAAQISLGLPTKIRALRMERQWTQGELARRAKMAQPRISEIETPGERKLNLDTLQRIASAFDIGLDVDFVPFGELIHRSEGFDPDSFSVQSFEPELAAATTRQLVPSPEKTALQDAFIESGKQSPTGFLLGDSSDLDHIRRIHNEVMTRVVEEIAKARPSTGLTSMEPTGVIDAHQFGTLTSDRRLPEPAIAQREQRSCNKETTARKKRGLHHRSGVRNPITKKRRTLWTKKATR